MPRVCGRLIEGARAFIESRMNGCLDFLGAQIHVVYLSPDCGIPKEAPMVEMLFKLARFLTRSANVDITTNRADIGNGDGDVHLS
jgi:hypothetical protein